MSIQEERSDALESACENMRAALDQLEKEYSDDDLNVFESKEDARIIYTKIELRNSLEKL